MIAFSEVRKHASPSDLWLVIDNKIYDFKKFFAVHPGGKDILLKYAGKDATEAFDEIHSREIL